MLNLKTLIVVLSLIAPFGAQYSYADNECVILLHGLGRSSASMVPLEKSLKESNYHVVNTNYDSRKHSISELTDRYLKSAVTSCGDTPKIHFVTHSLGGILVRQYMQGTPDARVHRVVMLGPPNQGSEAVNYFRPWPGAEEIGGPAFIELSVEESSVPKSLKPVNFELGVIAGTRTMNPILSMFVLPGSDDGKVTVESTKVEGMDDHIVVEASHVFMMRKPEVIALAKGYLKEGKFISTVAVMHNGGAMKEYSAKP